MNTKTKITSILEFRTEKAHLPSSGSVQVLIRITPPKKAGSHKARGVNLALAIDVSSSMSEPVRRMTHVPAFHFPVIPVQPAPNFPPHYPQPWPQPGAIPGIPFPSLLRANHVFLQTEPLSVQSKMSQAIGAACQAVDQLKNGDRLSLVTFNETARIVLESTEVTAENREVLKAKIRSLQANGNTDLHSGWLMAAEQVAKTLDAKKMNRVLVLSDGQTNMGKRNPDDICTDVSRLAMAGVSTTTFGIGEGFNEDLLEHMAESGNGNFYFIEAEGQLSQWFQEEFQGLSQLVGSAALLEFVPAAGVTVSANKNSYLQRDGKWMLPNLLQNKPVDSLFVLELEKVKSKSKTRALGQATLFYVDDEGRSHQESLSVIGEVVAAKAYAQEPLDHEVHVVNALLEVALAKRQATVMMSQGNYVGAKNALRSSFVSTSAVADGRTQMESVSLNAMLASYDGADKNMLRKSLVTENYKTRNSK